MKIEEVPQDPKSLRQGDRLQKLVYAVRKDGAYAGVRSLGWEVENYANQLAWDQVESRISEILQEIEVGKSSPIAYFMEKSLMDLSLLARYMGKWTWQVRRHLNPRGINRLSSRSLERYAEVFGISVERLIHFDAHKEEELRKSKSH